MGFGLGGLGGLGHFVGDSIEDGGYLRDRDGCVREGSCLGRRCRRRRGGLAGRFRVGGVGCISSCGLWRGR